MEEKKNTSSAADVDDDVGASKKGKRAAKGGKKKRAGDDDDEAAHDTGGGGAAESGVPNESIINYLADQEPNLPLEVLDELCCQVQPLLAGAVTAATEKVRASLQNKQQERFDRTKKVVEERFEGLALGLRALEVAKLQETPLYQHLLREMVSEPLHALLALRLEEATGTATEVTTANRKQCLDKLVAAQGASKVESLIKLAAVFAKPKDNKDVKEAKEPKEKGTKSKKGRKGDDVDDANDEAGPPDAAELYRAAADDSHMFCRKFDKKREKVVLQEQRSAIKAKLGELAPTDALMVCYTGLQMALNMEGIAGLAFPAEPWALRLAAGCLADSDQREKACSLCDHIEKGEDAAARDAAAEAWRQRFLDSS